MSPQCPNTRCPHECSTGNERATARLPPGGAPNGAHRSCPPEPTKRTLATRKNAKSTLGRTQRGYFRLRTQKVQKADPGTLFRPRASTGRSIHKLGEHDKSDIYC